MHERHRRVVDLARDQDALAHRRKLRALGVSHADIRSEDRAGHWRLVPSSSAWSSSSAWCLRHDCWTHGGLCAQIGIPPPERQVVRRLPDGRVHLDGRWKDVVVEVDGVQHQRGLAPIDDALRQNEVTLTNDKVLRIPVLGLRPTHPSASAQSGDLPS